jgi:hypothetical protein
MPITISPASTNLGEITVVENFTKTISAVTNDIGDTIVSVTVIASTLNSGVTLSNGTTSCSISGNYETPFTNTNWNWFSGGSYLNAQNYSNVPNAIGNLIRYQPDSTISQVYSYLVVATSNLGQSLSKTYTITVTNDWSEGQTQIQEVIDRQTTALGR